MTGPGGGGFMLVHDARDGRTRLLDFFVAVPRARTGEAALLELGEESGNFDECLALAREASASLGIQLLNSVNPFRLEGQKTIVFELLEQLAIGLQGVRLAAGLAQQPPPGDARLGGGIGRHDDHVRESRVERVPRLGSAGARREEQHGEGGVDHSVTSVPRPSARAWAWTARWA